MRIANLRAFRERAVLTQEELARKAGLSAPTLNRIERGHQEPRPTTVRKLARALGVDPQALLADETEEQS